MVRVLFIEPISATDPNQGLELEVNETMYVMLQREPLTFIRQSSVLEKGKCVENELGVGYVFGRLFKGGYEFLGDHSVDAGLTGILDVDALKADKDFEAALNEEATLLQISDRAIFEEFRRKHPAALWINVTMGDGIAQLWGHYNVKGDLDSLIIDYNCFLLDALEAEKEGHIKLETPIKATLPEVNAVEAKTSKRGQLSALEHGSYDPAAQVLTFQIPFNVVDATGPAGKLERNEIEELSSQLYKKLSPDWEEATINIPSGKNELTIDQMLARGLAQEDYQEELDSLQTALAGKSFKIGNKTVQLMP